MALSAATVWEVRPTVGSDNNGGGFVTGASGTDYSQQTSPQYALTGIASSGAGSTVLYASAAANMVGNIAQVISGTNFTTGFFQITSVSVGVSITFDRSVCTGVGASGVINIGGALATIGAAALVAGNTIYVKASGSLTVSATLTLNITSGGTSTAGILSFIGYTSTRGDGGQFTWTTTTNSVSLITITGGQNYYFQNINFTTSAGTVSSAVNVPNADGHIPNCTFRNCVFTGFTSSVSCPNTGNGNGLRPLIMQYCEIKNCTSDGILSQDGGIYLDCYIHGNSGNGVNLPGGSGNQGITSVFVRCVFYNNTTAGLSVNSEWMGIIILNCVFHSNTGDGLKFTGVAAAGTNAYLQNNIFTSNGGYGINYNVTSSYGKSWNEQYNAFYNNTSGAFNGNGLSLDASDITLTGVPFTNPSGGDFSLNSTAGAGAACKAAGFNNIP